MNTKTDFLTLRRQMFRDDAAQQLDDVIANMERDLREMRQAKADLLAYAEAEVDSGAMTLGKTMAKVLNRAIHYLTTNAGRNNRIDLLADLQCKLTVDDGE